ncbi:hypothetical protein COO60DRAFT_1269318 [Scenedesmus sp. NREL 46B-D3]|nr:hypothetical protein COO60DRAFT_1269318 [Scenedesmus sp. NREL 46B-D3]
MGGETGPPEAGTGQVFPDQYDQQLQAKLAHVRELFAGQPLPEIEVFKSSTEHFRMRTEFRVWLQQDEAYYVMFEKNERNGSLEELLFPVASQLICELMPLLRKELVAHPELRDKVFQVRGPGANFHSTLSKQAMITLVYRRQLDDVWREAARALRSRLLKALGPGACSELHIVGRSRKQKVCIDADHVFERMEVAGRSFEYMQVEGGFSQPNGGVCQHMLSWAVDATKGSSGDLLELYCGNGNFTVPLAQNFKQVVATEVSKASVAAARHNIAANSTDNIFLARMSSEEFTETWKVKGTRNRLSGLDWEQLSLDTLFVDPPRAGLDPATEQMLQDFEQVVYISCNPETLANNLRSVAHSHDIVRMAVFDQFPYTEHIEAGVVIKRKRDAAV